MEKKEINQELEQELNEELLDEISGGRWGLSKDQQKFLKSKAVDIFNKAIPYLIEGKSKKQALINAAFDVFSEYKK